MDNNGKIKVVWLCGFSNAIVREKLIIHVGWLSKVLRLIIHSPIPVDSTDKGVWNTNAIHEFEQFDDVELHVIAPCSFLADKVQEFDINGVYYHFFQEEETQLFASLYKKIRHTSVYPYRRNRRIVKRLLHSIQPDIVHLIGAENPQYSITMLDVPVTIPTIVQLQTLMNNPDFKKNYPIDEASYKYRSSVEWSIIQKADYIGTSSNKFIEIVRNQIKPNARFVGISLAVGEEINMKPAEKAYDFVYFANNINKSCDLALEAFGLAFQSNPSITLDIVGGYDEEIKKEFDSIIEKYGINNAVVFEGRLKTHTDVINQIRRARFALLPLKIDLVSGTIREAMANGLPVLTTDTGELGTQQLNLHRRSTLISPKGNHRALADNMLILLSDAQLANELRNNAAITIQEKYDNHSAMRKWVETYKEIILAKNSSKKNL